MNSNPADTATNSSNITVLPKPRPRQAKVVQRFTIMEFIRPRTGEVSWRVTGSKIGGTRIRENFKTEAEARVRQVELENENLQIKSDITIKATRLDDARLQLAEESFRKLGDDWERIVDAVDHWKKSGLNLAAKESPTLDDAVAQYLAWLAGNSMRDATKRHWRIRMTLFKNTASNIRIGEFTPEHIDAFLATRDVSPSGKDTDRRAVSRFFSWCIERPRRWATSNPCREVKIDLGARKPVVILTAVQSERLLRAAESYKDGKLVPYVALCLFAGLRPNSEAVRLSWKQINLADGEIRVESSDSKNEESSRVVAIDSTLKKWLRSCEGREIFPAGWTKQFNKVKAAAGLTSWTPDIMRHTAISHYFRKCGSYGLTAEQFGNSEAIIKKHYKGRVSTADTKVFYSILPSKK